MKRSSRVLVALFSAFLVFSTVGVTNAEAVSYNAWPIVRQSQTSTQVTTVQLDSDTVTYTARVIPAGQRLHIDYVFASEEYPEYVGSEFNDVMAIYVDGANGTLVPGTDLPVSVNTVNHLENAQYYVDNSSGAAGYNTSMDGLTVPLRCSVPVEPGKPVDIVIALADASDAIYDSAVALLDQGIWSD